MSGAAAHPVLLDWLDTHRAPAAGRVLVFGAKAEADAVAARFAVPVSRADGGFAGQWDFVVVTAADGRATPTEAAAAAVTAGGHLLLIAPAPAFRAPAVGHWWRLVSYDDLTGTATPGRWVRALYRRYGR